MCPYFSFIPFRISVNAGATFRTVDLSDDNHHINDTLTHEHENGNIHDTTTSYNLFAFPGECNFSGIKYDLEWIHKYHQLDTHNRYVLL